MNEIPCLLTYSYGQWYLYEISQQEPNMQRLLSQASTIEQTVVGAEFMYPGMQFTFTCSLVRKMP